MRFSYLLIVSMFLFTIFTTPAMAQAGNTEIATDSTSPISPDYLTVEFSIVLAFLTMGTLYASLKLRSMLGIFVWMLMIVVLVFTFFTEFEFIWFWVMVIVEVLTLGLASIEYTRAAARAKS